MKTALVSWSSGKDSAWALHTLRWSPDFDVVGIFSTVNKKFDRVAMHAVRVELLQQQAEKLDLPLDLIQIPHPCSNADYEKIMRNFTAKARKDGVECFAFGDLFLDDIRSYRVRNLQDTGIDPVFPLWGRPTDKLSREMVDAGLRAVITCVDPKQLSTEFIGKKYDDGFLDDIPLRVDPCGENGEFHSFVYAGPMFDSPIEISVGGVLHRDGFVFADVLAGG